MAGRGRALPEDSARRRINDVLGQARAALRQSQQFRSTKSDRGVNNNLSSRLIFQQQNQEPDYWSSIAEPQVLEPEENSGDYYSNVSKPAKKGKKREDAFGPFRESAKGPTVASTSARQPQRQKATTTMSQETRRQSVTFASPDSSSVSLNTNDLMISDAEGDAYTTDTDTNISLSSVKRSKSGPGQKGSKPVSSVPTTPKLTPLVPATTAVPLLVDNEENEQIVDDVEQDDGGIEDNNMGAARPSSSRGPTAGEDDPPSFSRSFLMKSKDPHWFEKALLVRGETISDAAYKAFKKIYADKEAEEEKSMLIEEEKKKPPVFKDVADPEYTADWISDAASTTAKSEIDMPESEYADQEIDENDLDEDTASMIRTATELQVSGILDEISENLQDVLDISEMAESQDFSRMSAEEKSFAQEYDKVMLNKNEPLQSIFDGPGPEQEGAVGSYYYDFEEDKGTHRNSEQQDDENDNTLVETTGHDITNTGDEYENTFLSTKTSKSFKTPSHTISSSTGREVTKLSSKSKATTSVDVSKSKPKSASVTTSKSKSASASSSSKSKSKSAIGSSKTRSSLPPEHALDPPTSRYQKNIQTILEKEVYQKELKRVKSEKAKEERDARRLRKLAKASFEANKKVTYKEPDYTEILLPELFKYKSVSGLQAAKAKKASGAIGPTPTINFGAPYFTKTGAVSADDYGVNNMAAQVDSLDIPDLVREVLASNERMYRMTVEASEEMAKGYRRKMRAKSSRNNNRRT